MSSILKRLKHFDAYPKTLEDFRVKTFTGATISVICTVCIVLLFVYEWRAYVEPEIHQELFVDISKGEKFSINIDITFPHLACSLLSLDAIDVAGEQQVHVVKGIRKKHLNKYGRELSDAEVKAKLKAAPVTAKLDINTTCGSCYGAQNPDHPCCNTCDEVKLLYRRRGWEFSPLDIAQCVNEMAKTEDEGALSEEQVNKLIESGDGCRMEGFLEVNRVAGNFHIAPGFSYQDHHMHVHDVKMSQLSKFNTSHIINHFYFGAQGFPNQVNPLEGTAQFSGQDPALVFQYFVKIVPTTYEYANGGYINNTYQYSATKSTKSVNVEEHTKILPGVFFQYELSPIMVKFIERHKSFTHFLTSCCAIIGGLFTVAGLFDSILYRYYNLYKKIQLNKQT